MKKNRSALRRSPAPSDRSTGGLILIAAVGMAGIAGGLLAVRLFTAADGPLGWWHIPVLAGLVILLSFTLAHVFGRLGLSSAWAARGAVLGGFFPVLVFWVYASLAGTSTLNFWLLPGMVLAACGGSSLAGLLSDGFVENNAPPSQPVRVDVLRWHKQAIGDPPPVPTAKRIFDILLAGVGMVVSLPLWVTFGLLIWLESPGPVVFVKNSVGKGGYNFHQYKFRTMVRGAEHESGPVLAGKGDGRILRIGSFLRKSALDELPQLINILKGEMSFVGPRPQRTVLVHQYLQDVPDYARRHQLPPGLAGLAQVAAGYDITQQEKLRWDLLYIEQAGLKYDLWLLGLAFVLVFWLRWKKGGAESGLPRRWLRLDQDRPL